MANIYYVSVNGSDENDGLSMDSAFPTLQQAADITQAGDTVYVMDGTYTQPDPGMNILTIRNSGTSEAWITYKAYPGHRPKLKSHNWHAIDIQGASYIIVEGFTLEGNNANITLDYALSHKENVANPATSGNGIGIQGTSNRPGENAHHIIIRNNEVYNFGGGGIYTRGGDYITIENNSVHGNAWYSPFGNSGISIWGGLNIDDYSGYKIIIRGNIVYNNKELVPWHKYGRITDGNGVIIDTLYNTDTGVEGGHYHGRTLVENNVVSGSGGRGIAIFQSDRVDVVNNTTFRNSQHPDINDGEITAIAVNDVRVFNNILYASDGLPANTVFEAEDVIYDYNLVFNSTHFTTSAPNNKVGQDPLFVNPEIGDFSLQAHSPALNAASEFLMAAFDHHGTQRPLDGSGDIGAIEHVFEPEPTFEAEPVFEAEQVFEPEPVLESKPVFEAKPVLEAERIFESNRTLHYDSSATKAIRRQPLVLQGTNRSDRLIGKHLDDQLTGTGGNDVLLGRRGRDLLRGGAGDDKLIGGKGSDLLFGGLGHDVFVLGRGAGQDQIRDYKDRQDKIDLVESLTFGDLEMRQQGQNVLLSVGQKPLALLSHVNANLLTAADFI